MKKILLTGHRGFIGRRIYNELMKKGYEVTGFDIGDRLNDEKYDYIVHFAARTLIRNSLEKPYEYYKDGLDLTLFFLEKARKDESTFIFPTSGSIEEPTNPYSLSKKNAVEWINLYGNLYGVKSHILKLFNIYGENSGKGALYFFCEAAVKGSTATIFGDGNHVRDYTHVSDVAKAVRLIVEGKVAEGTHELGTGRGTSVMGLVHLVEKISGKHLSVEHKPYVLSEADVLRAHSPLIKEPLLLEEGIKLVLNSIELAKENNNSS